MGQHRKEEENQDVIKVSDDDRNVDQKVSPEYTIHGAGIGDQSQATDSSIAGGSVPRRLPFRFDKSREVQEMPIPNHLVRSSLQP